MNTFCRLTLGIVSIGVAAASVNAKLVALPVDIVIDQVAPEDEGMYKLGQHDHARIVYDDTKIDRNKHVRIVQEAHLIGGHYHPNFDTEASMLDMSSLPYKLNYVSPPTHGRPLVVIFEAPSQRMAILGRPDFHMLIAGHYTIDPKPMPYDAEAEAKLPAGPPPGALPPH